MKKKLLIIIFWLGVWEVLSRVISNPILIAGPLDTLKALYEMLSEKKFYLAVRNSFLNITGGIFLGAFIGIFSAALSGAFGIIEDFLSPFIKVLKSIPVVSFVVIVLLWFGNTHLSLEISAVITMPLFYLSYLEGIKCTDKKMLEMAAVFKMSFLSRVRYIYLPSLKGTIKSSLSLAVGMGWRSGAAAEVIGQPMDTLGNGLYRAKIFLETDRLFAWTVVIILMSVLSEKIFRRLLDLLWRDKEKNNTGSRT